MASGASSNNNNTDTNSSLSPAGTTTASNAKPQIVRLLTLGDSGSGKSSLLLRYTQNDFTDAYMPTIGIDFRLKTVELDGKVVKVQVWDTAGQERFRTITHNYYRGAHGIALVYDITSESSFNNIRKWVHDVHAYAESNVCVVLIGNKLDAESKRAVPTERGAALADEFEVEFFECSAKNDTNVQQAFGALVARVVVRLAAEAAAANSARKRTVLVDAAAGKTKSACPC